MTKNYYCYLFLLHSHHKEKVSAMSDGLHYGHFFHRVTLYLYQ